MSLGLALTVAQTLLACLLSGEADPGRAYLKLYQWDGGWYASIVEHGYSSPVYVCAGKLGEGNLAFFPAYPLAARVIQFLFSLGVEQALLLTAQLSCCGLWTFLLLFFRRWRIPADLAVLGILAILTHPGGFFLVASYSESLYLMGVLGFLYWAGESRWSAKMLAAIPGFIMTATRLVGLPVLIYPVLHAWLTPGLGRASFSSRWRQVGRAGALSGLAGTGAALFLAFCYWRFGQWDLYMKTQQDGWGVHANYLAVFSARIFHVHWPLGREGFIDPEFVSRLAVPAAWLVFAALPLAEWYAVRRRADTAWQERLPLYACAWLLFYVPVCGHACRGMSSMIRFALCVQILLVLAGVHLLARLRPLRRPSRIWAAIAFALWSTASFAFQIALTYRFTHGKWVA